MVLDALSETVGLVVSVLTVPAKCYLMAHVYATPNLRKLDAKISCPDDTNNANVVSNNTLRDVLKALRVALQPTGCPQQPSDGNLANIINIISQIP